MIYLQKMKINDIEQTKCAHDAMVTSFLHQNNVTTLFWRYNDVACPLGGVNYNIHENYEDMGHNYFCEKVLQSRNTKLHITFNKYRQRNIDTNKLVFWFWQLRGHGEGIPRVL